ncbi:CbiQ family ECF transporter T component [Eubacterium aggregans]|uniref:CbiQ family ECF transporter T component n=1 Tax=Eubacterium aggregans TaxID=81409 RepID=UPI003F2DD30B
MPITTGGLSFLTILLKICFCVTAVLILIATTGLPVIAYQLLRIHIPRILVEQILLIYRYISVLLGEVARITTAYHL